MSKVVEVTQEDAEKLETIPTVDLIKAASEVKQIDPVELEAAMVEKERKRLEAEPDPVEIASMMLTLYTPRFCAIVDRLSNRQLRRVTKSIVEFPIGKTYKHNDPLEAECFAIAKNLMDAKYVLIADTYNQNREKIFEEAAKAAAQVETAFGEETKENENG